jgi:Ni,Fe-hydrogenase I cytochrome b subunit
MMMMMMIIIIQFSGYRLYYNTGSTAQVAIIKPVQEKMQQNDTNTQKLNTKWTK